MAQENASGAPVPRNETWGRWSLSFKRHYEKFGFGIWHFVGLGITIAKLGRHVVVLTRTVCR